MATIASAPRVIFAAGFAFAIALAPVVAPRAVADPPACTNNASPGDVSLNCAPDGGGAQSGGAPSEQQLTQDNTDQEHAGSHR